MGDPTSPDAPPPWLLRVLASMQRDSFFWLSLGLCLLLVVFVPQVSNIVFRTVVPPAELWANWADFFQALGFILFLAALLAGSFLALLVVVPPTFLSIDGEGAWPIQLPWRWFGWGLAASAMFLALGLGARWAFQTSEAPFNWHWWSYLVVLAIAAAFLVPLGRLVAWSAGWLEKATRKTSFVARRRVALVVGALGLVMLLWGWYTAAGWPYRFAAGLCGQVLGWLALPIALWLVLDPKDWGCAWSRLLPIHRALGRLLGWLVISLTFGELLWWATAVPLVREVVSFRLYAIWAVLAVVIAVVATASWLDTCQNVGQGVPLRGPLLLLLAFIGLAGGMLAPEGSGQSGANDAEAEKWPEHLLARLDALPPEQPVVFVCASGGGSRAALFTGLILESLAREPIAEGRSWFDQVALLSTVSGGSLGTARFVHGYTGPGWESDPRVYCPRDNLRHTVRTDLLAHLDQEQKDLRQRIDRLAQPEEGGITEALAAVTKYIAAAKDGEGDPGPLGWALASPVMDDLCADFMAPIFRGAITPRLSRGQSLEAFWADLFAWGRSADERGYDRTALGLGTIGYDWKTTPLVIFNATDVRRGARVAIGFPRLPRGLLLPRLDERELKESGQVRFPPGSLTDVAEGRSMTLAQAVRASANFPFGFNVITLPRRFPARAEDEDVYCARRDKLGQPVDPTDGLVKLLDGGIVDNTGMDTLYQALRGIEGQARQNATAARLWQALRQRVVVLIEIDSGQKPAPPGGLNRRLSALLDPLEGLDNASFSNADMAKRRYLKWMREAFTPHPDAPFRRIKVECNHFDEPNVMTAWSLGTRDKGQVIERWLVDWHLARAALVDVAQIARQWDQSRQLSRKEAALKKGDGDKAPGAAAKQLRKDLEKVQREMKQTSDGLQQKLNQRRQVSRQLFEKTRPPERKN